LIVADTGGILALLDRDDRHHSKVKRFFTESRSVWTLPWAILPEVGYLATKKLGDKVAVAFLHDIKGGHFLVDAHVARDLPRALALVERYADLGMGLVDAVVMAQAERLRASVIVTLDERHFRAVHLALKMQPRLVPLDS
jgi:predicted nucleic acid-binding protein